MTTLYLERNKIDPDFLRFVHKKIVEGCLKHIFERIVILIINVIPANRNLRGRRGRVLGIYVQ